MKKEDIIETLYIKDKIVNVGIDDYGQCYYFEFENDNDEIESIGCGAYNSNYLEEIYSYFDPKGVNISIIGKEAYDKQTESILENWVEKGLDKKYPEDFKELKQMRESTDYEIYDFDKMYKERK